MKLKELLQKLSSQQEEDSFPADLEAYFDNFPNLLVKSETLQKAFGVTSYEMEELYSEAYAYYQQDKYLQSSILFRWLVLLNPFFPKYWTGLGASLQLLEKYEKALHAYAISALLDGENPYPHYHAYECYLELQDKEEGEKALDAAYQRAMAKADYKDLEEEIFKIKKLF